MTSQEAIEQLNALSDHDPEAAHGEADSILIAALRSNGLSEVADAWDACCHRVGFWYA